MDDMCAMLLRKERLSGVGAGDFLCFIDGDKVPATSTVPTSPTIISFCVKGREHSVLSEGASHFFMMLGRLDQVVRAATRLTDGELKRVAAFCKHASIPYDNEVVNYTIALVDKKRKEMEVESTRVELLREIIAIANKKKDVTPADLKEIGNLQKTILKTFTKRSRGSGGDTDEEDDEVESVGKKKKKVGMKEKETIQPSVQTVVSSFDNIEEEEERTPVILSGKKKKQGGRGTRMAPRHAKFVDAYVTKEMDLDDAATAALEDLEFEFNGEEDIPSLSKVTNRIRNKRNELKKK